MCFNFCKPKPTPFDPIANGYSIMFTENFLTPIDWNKWTHTYPAEQDQKELTKWTRDAVYQDEQGLHLQALKGDGVNLCGQICSRNFLEIKYGYIKFVAKFPPGGFLYFCALWMFNQATGWLPEIDIIEFTGADSRYVSFTHWWDNLGVPAAESLDKKFKVDLSKDFHEYSCEWTSTKLTWFVDGIEYFTTSNNIPQDSLFLVANVQSGGPEGGFKHLFTEEESGAEMIIKLLEIYQKYNSDSRQLCCGCK